MMRTESMHQKHLLPAESSSIQQEGPLTNQLLQERMHEEKQPVHARWFVIALFSSIIPFGLTFASSFQPLSEFITEDSKWDPPVSAEDMAILDGAMIVPSVFMPLLLGITLDAAWSLNLGLLACLMSSILGQFLVAMGIAWHSFGLLLTGRVISGICFGSIFVVANTMAAQFNRRRRATAIAFIQAVKTIAISLSAFWIQSFTTDVLQQDYEKMTDMMLIFSLLCLGIGFLWTPLVDSFGMTDSAKSRLWKWHVPMPVWALAVSLIVVTVFNTDIFINRPIHERNALIFGSVIVSPCVAYMLDRSEKSQGGSLSLCRWLLTLSVFTLVSRPIMCCHGTNSGSDERFATLWFYQCRLVE
jgi:MFS family permease